MPAEKVTFDELAALALGELHGPDAERVRAAALASPETAATLKRLEQTVELLRTDDSAPPPGALLGRVGALFRAGVPPRPTWFDQAATLLLELLFDSRLSPAMGLRSAGSAADTVELRFGRADTEVEISVRAESGSGVRRVMGQVDPPIPPDSGVALMEKTGNALEGRTDTQGYFHITASPGVYALAIHCPEGVLLSPDFEVT